MGDENDYDNDDDDDTSSSGKHFRIHQVIKHKNHQHKEQQAATLTIAVPVGSSSGNQASIRVIDQQELSSKSKNKRCLYHQINIPLFYLFSKLMVFFCRLCSLVKSKTLRKCRPCGEFGLIRTSKDCPKKKYSLEMWRRKRRRCLTEINGITY